MANDDRDSGLMSPYQPGAAGNLQNGWPENVRTVEEQTAEHQGKFDAARTRNESTTTVTERQGGTNSD